MTTPKCDYRGLLVHNAGSRADCPECVKLANWTPPIWQLVTPNGIFDYDKRPRNPLVRGLIWWRGWKWRRNPALQPGRYWQAKEKAP